jgi:hypothetical protein
LPDLSTENASHYFILRQVYCTLLASFKVSFSYRTLAATHGLSASALCRHTRHLRHQLVIQERRTEQTQLSQFLEKLALPEVRRDRLFRQAEESRSLSVSLGCLQESLRLLSLREKVRHSLVDHL